MTQTNIIEINITFNDIPQLATTLWYAGCNLTCEGCHNNNLKDFKKGYTLNQLYSYLKKRKNITDWLVHLGGNPLDSIDTVLNVSEMAKELGYKQFLYSGYTYTEFKNMFDCNTHQLLLNNIDYIKTGRYDIRYDRNCSVVGKEYFFATLNQEVYHSNKYSWEKYYYFDGTIHGNLFNYNCISTNTKY